MNRPLSAVYFYLSMLGILIIGLFSITVLNSILNPAQANPLERLAIPVTIAPLSLSLNLSSPPDHMVIFTPDLLIHGKTTANSLVLISTDNEDYTLQADQQGDFSDNLVLSEGSNQILVTVFDVSGNSKSESRSVFHSKEKL